jgi:hypothetical protein
MFSQRTNFRDLCEWKGSNLRPFPYQRNALPLSYTRTHQTNLFIFSERTNPMVSISEECSLPAGRQVPLSYTRTHQTNQIHLKITKEIYQKKLSMATKRPRAFLREVRTRVVQILSACSLRACEQSRANPNRRIAPIHPKLGIIQSTPSGLPAMISGLNRKTDAIVRPIPNDMATTSAIWSALYTAMKNFACSRT